MSFVPHGPLSSANFVQHMANDAKSEKVAWALTIMSATLIGMMVVKEARDLFGSKDTHGHFHEPRAGRSR